MPQRSITSTTGLAGPRRAVHFSYARGDHRTPPIVLAAVRAVFGDRPDLDPCSNSHDAPNVDAHAHYTAADDGLRQPWRGRVFLNPPYGRTLPSWIAKARHEWTRGEVRELIALLPFRGVTRWFDEMYCDVTMICFWRGRLTFVGQPHRAPFPSMVVYFGARPDVFANVFGPLGTVLRRRVTPSQALSR